MMNEDTTKKALQEEISTLRQRVAALEQQCQMSQEREQQLREREVTKYRHMEELLQQTKERLKRYFDLSIVGMVSTSLEKGWLEFNNKLCEMLGYTPEELRRMTWADLTHPDDLEADVEQFNRVLAGEINGYTMDKRYIRKDGSVMYANLVAEGVRKPDGSVDTFVAILQDISDRKAAEDEIHRLNEKLEERVAQKSTELQEQQRILQGIIDNSPAVIFVKDREGRYILVNEQATVFAGQIREEIIGRTDAELLPPEVAQRFQEQDRRILESRKSIQREEIVQFGDDERTYLSFGFPLYNDQGEIYAVCGISTDITDKKRAETEQAALQQQVIDAQEDAIRELSTPLIPLSNHVVLMPLIGTIDTRRSQQVMETLLEGIASYQADIAIVDITGVNTIDTQVANAVVQTAKAVRLLGASIILSGIGPAMAQTFIHLGANLEGITSWGSLQRAIAYALQEPNNNTTTT